MRIELHELYASKWKAGYLQTSKSGRRYLVLYNSNTDRTITSYARYLLSVKIGRFLEDGEEADHIDEDRTNDDPNNLQVVSCTDNKRKNQAHRRKNRVEKHGTLTEYRYCKCEKCKAAKREWSAKYYASRNNALQMG